jgi:predicted AAA+ superfamily ATPase
MRNGVVNNFVPLHQRADGGAIFENFVYTQLGGDDDVYQNIRFWRSHSKKEVDFVWQAGTEKPYPIEVKLHHAPRQSFPSGLKSFVGSYTPPRAFIVHTGQFNTIDFNQTRIFVIPAWAV